ncbi:MAG: hypothetical protein KAR06_00355 [Deltaproteobacteria bacterium]|nr:hypothetical protein [Deltaproteobacteria bacterium]
MTKKKLSKPKKPTLKKPSEKEKRQDKFIEESKGGGSYFTDNNKGIDFVSSGCELLNCALGGGWPLGRVVNIVGDRSSGKTLLAIEACANFVKDFPEGGIEYHEAEAAFDKRYAQALGMPVDKIEFTEGSDGTVEGLFESLRDRCEKQQKSGNKPFLYIIDSLDALSDRSEKDRDIDAGTFGGNKAKKMSELFRRLIVDLENSNILLVVVSQVRDNIGVTFGAKHTRSGGKALDFYASIVLWLSEKGKIKKTIRGVERPVGIQVKAHCKKNKVSLPYRECEFPIIFGYGVDDLIANLDWLIKVKELPDEFAGKTAKQIAFLLRNAKAVETINGLNTIVRLLWAEIESEFLPKETKY